MVLTQDDTDADDLNAVRVNIPLSRVLSFERTNLVSFAGLITVTFDPKSSLHDPSAEQSASSSDDKETMSFIDSVPEKQVLQVGIMRDDPEWNNVMSYVAKARTPESSGSVDWPGSRVYIDVDPRASEESETSDSNLSALVKSVSLNLGLDTTKEIWSTYCLSVSSSQFASCVFLQFAKPTSIATS